MPTVSKTHFTPLGGKKLCPEKRSVVEDEKQKSRAFSVDTGSRRTGPVDRGKRPTFTLGNFRRNQPARFLSFRADTHTKSETFGAGAGSARPLLRSPNLSGANPPVCASLRSGGFTRDRHRQQLSSCAVSAHGLWVNWCSVSIHLTGDPISMTSSSSSVQGLHDQLLRRERHFGQYCGIKCDA